MAVTIVRTTPGQSPTVNPAKSIGSITANHTLFGFVVEADGNFPGVPTDTQSNSWSSINDIQLAAGISAKMAFCLRAKAGATTVTMPTSAGSAYFLSEMSGVMDPVAQQFVKNGTSFTVFNPNVPDDTCVSSFTNLSAATCDIASRGPNGSLIYALVCAIGTVTITPDGTAWNPLGSGQALGMSFAASTIQLASHQELTPGWTFSAPSTGAILMCSFPSA